MDQPLVIRLHPNAVIHERQDGVWFQSDSQVVFQHPDMSTMSELVAVFLHHLGGRFTAIRKVGYHFLRRQPDGRFVNLLVDTLRSRQVHQFVQMSSIGEMVVEMTQFGVGSGRLVLGCSMARRKSRASV
ncbi:hypothetical protein PIB30_092975 [Stylosanthes scabra]|uniref:Uncharacterized protein n=1 Tax=Stylosanthes scabra TaxID=79078 RepID=A0ABU6VVD1_9FABA|nr:hypothetical protein [Stylosanthes scabra]